MTNAELSEFERVNEDRAEFGAFKGDLRLSLPRDAPGRWGDEFAITAAQILLPVCPGPHLDYRAEVAYRFQEHNYEPKKRKEGKPYRTEEQTRLDRAFTKVAEEYDKTEPTIREACTKPYDDDSPEKFRQHCTNIMDQIDCIQG